MDYEQTQAVAEQVHTRWHTLLRESGLVPEKTTRTLNLWRLFIEFAQQDVFDDEPVMDQILTELVEHPGEEATLLRLERTTSTPDLDDGSDVGYDVVVRMEQELIGGTYTAGPWLHEADLQTDLEVGTPEQPPSLRTLINAFDSGPPAEALKCEGPFSIFVEAL